MKQKLYSLLQATIIIIGTATLCYWFKALPFILSLVINFTIIQIITGIIEHFVKVYKIKHNHIAVTAKTLIKEQIQWTTIHILTILAWFVFVFLAIMTALHLI